jgi:putative SOS response-associated peptidase YedK
MCGRLRINSADELRAMLNGERVIPKWRDLWESADNLCPSRPVPALLHDADGLVVERLHWGLIPSWAKDRKIGNKCFNARAETIAEKPAFRAAFRSRRCVVLAAAWYEWATIDGKRVPHAFQVEGAPFVMLAGLWEEWRSPEGEIVRSCTIVTTSASEATNQFHDRMPVVLDAEAREIWLDPQAPADLLQELLVPFDGTLRIAPARL